MSWTDKDIDKLYQEGAEKLSFDYKDEYWNEFSASLSAGMSEGGVEDTGASEVDQIYQAEAENLAFEYKDAYWKEMVSMLNRRRRPDFLWFGMALMFLGLLTTATLIREPLVETTSDRVYAENATTQQDVVSDDVVYELESGTTTESANVNTAGVNQKQNGVESALIEDVTTNYAPIDAADASGAGDLVGNGADNIDEVANGIDSESMTPIANDADDNSIRADVDEEVDKPLESENDRTDNISSDRANDEADVSDANVDDRLLDELGEKGEVNRLPLNAFAVTEYDKELIPTNSNYVMPDFSLPTRSTFYVEVNGGISQSLITPSDKLSTSVGVGLGAQFGKGRFTFTTGVNGIWSFHDDIVLNRQAKVYGFGSDVYQYTLKYDQIYSLEAVLTAGYRMGRHQVTVGVRPSYAFGSKVGFTMMEEEIETERSVVYGHMEGISRFGIKPMIGYSVDLPANLTLGLNIGTQLMPSVNEEYIDGVNNKLPIDGQLYIRKGIRFRRR